MSQTAIWTISMPKTLEKEVLKIGKKEHRSKSDIVREALRKYTVSSFVSSQEAMFDRLCLELEYELGKIDFNSLPTLEEQMSKI